MGIINPSKMPKAKTITRQDDPNKVEMFAGGGLYANIHAKKQRIADGSHERMRKPGTEGAPSSQAFEDAARTAKAHGGLSFSPK